MTATSEGLSIESRVVVVFDICSSSRVLEDLMLTGNLAALRDVLISMKNFLREESEAANFEVYKFIGDGWILLFPFNVGGKRLIQSLEELSRFFKDQASTRIHPKLQTTPEVMGLTFGIDSGELVRVVMLRNREYLGRPLNIACRLQTAIKDKDPKPQYKALFSKHTFRRLGLPSEFRRVVAVERTLRNIQGGDRYECVKLNLVV